jgi:hypothetical protein
VNKNDDDEAVIGEAVGSEFCGRDQEEVEGVHSSEIQTSKHHPVVLFRN